jgi:hypothetical protein
MRWILLVAVLVLLALATSAFAANVGLGFMVGEPTEFSMKA